MTTPVSEFMPQVHNKAAELLSIDPQDIVVTEELKDQGLDSVRIAEILAFMHQDGWDVDLADLMEDTSLEAWTELLTELEY